MNRLVLPPAHEKTEGAANQCGREASNLLIFEAKDLLDLTRHPATIVETAEPRKTSSHEIFGLEVSP